MKPAHRDISPFLQRIRQFLLGRKHTPCLRFEDGLSDRTQKPPEIPGGPAHVLSANYYYKRDARRLVKPPITLGEQKKLGDETAKPAELPKPGPVHIWD